MLKMFMCISFRLRLKYSCFTCLPKNNRQEDKSKEQLKRLSLGRVGYRTYVA